MRENTNLKRGSGCYQASYASFRADLYEQIRRDAYGEDIGQNSWLTSRELDHFHGWLNLRHDSSLLDIACGAGGPALRLATLSGCSITGIDIHEAAVVTAQALAAERGLAEVARFLVLDAGQALPFADRRFDAIACIDAINHFPNRLMLIAECARMLTAGGRLLFTDPLVVTGPLSDAEVAVRSSAGFCLFVPHGYDQHVIEQCGLRTVVAEDVTQGVADAAEGRRAARGSRERALRAIEGDQTFEAQQEFLRVAGHLAREKRLSRSVFVAERGDEASIGGR